MGRVYRAAERNSATIVSGLTRPFSFTKLETSVRVQEEVLQNTEYTCWDAHDDLHFSEQILDDLQGEVFQLLQKQEELETQLQKLREQSVWVEEAIAITSVTVSIDWRPTVDLALPGIGHYAQNRADALRILHEEHSLLREEEEELLENLSKVEKDLEWNRINLCAAEEDRASHLEDYEHYLCSVVEEAHLLEDVQLDAVIGEEQPDELQARFHRRQKKLLIYWGKKDFFAPKRCWKRHRRTQWKVSQ